MKHLILTGACYVDTILNVPYFPGEDEKLRATTAQVRRGGNCPNSIEVLLQLLSRHPQGEGNNTQNGGAGIKTHLISVLPARDSPATAMIAESFGPSLGHESHIGNLDFCLYRSGHTTPASSYVIRSAATGSRTIVNHYGLPEMEAVEFKATTKRFFDSHQTAPADSSVWHFEGRAPGTTLACIKHLQSQCGSGKDIAISVEVEKPGRAGLRELAALANIVFFSKTWAENEGYASAEDCLRGEGASLPQAALLFCTWGAQVAAAFSPRTKGSILHYPAPDVPAESIVDAVGAGDTFVAGVLYQLATNKATQEQNGDWTVDDDTIVDILSFAVNLASKKIKIDGFQGLV